MYGVCCGSMLLGMKLPTSNAYNTTYTYQQLLGVASSFSQKLHVPLHDDLDTSSAPAVQHEAVGQRAALHSRRQRCHRTAV